MKKPWCYIDVNPGLKVKIDKEDFDKANKLSWRAIKSATGRLKVIASVRKGEMVTTITLGRYLLPPPRGKQVYPRRFQDGLDYRKDNLVICTVQERQRLLPKRRAKSSSQYRGVSFSRADKKWKAGIEVDGRAINLGHYKYEEEAAKAYNTAAKKYFGDMAYQNQIKKMPKRKTDKSRKR